MKILKRLTLLIIILIIGNVSSGHGHWLYESVSSFMNTAGHYVTVVAEGAEKVAHGIQTLENILNDAIEENCEFQCPKDSTPRQNPRYKRHTNGCGSLGVKWEMDLLPVEQLSTCCDKHDYCYDTCNQTKDDCDKKFKRCLYKICEMNKNIIDASSMNKCKGAAKFMYTGTLALGCTAYKNAQNKACLCDAKSSDEL
ncbi:Phospholipase A2, group XIIA [Chamberlinius hualienensis]